MKKIFNKKKFYFISKNWKRDHEKAANQPTNIVVCRPRDKKEKDLRPFVVPPK